MSSSQCAIQGEAKGGNSIRKASACLCSLQATLAWQTIAWIDFMGERFAAQIDNIQYHIRMLCLYASEDWGSTCWLLFKFSSWIHQFWKCSLLRGKSGICSPDPTWTTLVFLVSVADCQLGQSKPCSSALSGAQTSQVCFSWMWRQFDWFPQNTEINTHNPNHCKILLVTDYILNCSRRINKYSFNLHNLCI